MTIVNTEIEAYCLAICSPEPDSLFRINRDTYANVLQPRMLSGHLQGRLLSLISHLLAPKLILEIGAYTGYSAICLSEGLQPGGKVITVDANEELESIARRNIAAANCTDKIELVIAKAADFIPSITQPIDLAFIDADKENYGLYYDLIINKIRTGGLIIIDNVLWSGKVIDPKAKDSTTNYIRTFNQKIFEDPRVEQILIPLRDGLLVARKT